MDFSFYTNCDTYLSKKAVKRTQNGVAVDQIPGGEVGHFGPAAVAGPVEVCVGEGGGGKQ